MATEIHAVHAFNRYLWAKIKEAGIMTEADYSGLVPVIPVEETAEFMTVIDAQAGIGSKPYMVYTWSKVPSGQAWFYKTNDFAYAVRSADDVKMRKLLNLFESLNEAYDFSAIKANEWIQANSPAAHKKYQFKTISINTLGGQMPAEVENGVNESLVTIRAQYVVS